VLDQTPRGGLLLAPDTPVELVISTGPAPTPTATQPATGCLGDERLGFNPPIPVLNQPALIDAYSSRPHAGVALTGPGNLTRVSTSRAIPTTGSGRPRPTRRGITNSRSR
jgi:hypothetical protein